MMFQHLVYKHFTHNVLHFALQHSIIVLVEHSNFHDNLAQFGILLSTQAFKAFRRER